MTSKDYWTRRIVKQGGSLAVTIPAVITREMHLRDTQEVKVYIVGGVICVQRVDTGGFRPGVVAVRAVVREELNEGA